jgi:hypothetical protein
MGIKPFKSTQFSYSDINGATAETAPAAGDEVLLADVSGSVLRKMTRNNFQKRVIRSAVTTDPATLSDEIIALSGASFTVTLPTAVGIGGKIIELYHNGTSLSQVYTLATTSAQTVGGIASGAYILCTNGEYLKLVSDNANWLILDHVAKTALVSNGVITVTGTTANPTKATGITVDRLLWSRDGEFGRFRIEYAQSNTTSAATGTGDYLFALPTNIAFDTNFATMNTTLGSSASLQSPSSWGTATTGVSGAAGVGYVSPYDSTKFRLLVNATSATTQVGAVGAAWFNPTEAGLRWSCDFVAKIANWRP